MDLILASESAQKKSLLNKLGLVFSVQPSKIDEKSLKGEESEAYVRRMALEKAEVVSKTDKDAYVIGHDMVIDLDGKIIEKPEDAADAKKILEALSGKSHNVISSTVIMKNSKPLYQGVQSTVVTFKKLSSDVIDGYVKGGEGLDKAGAYAIQGDGGMFVESIDGSYFNVVGLAISPLVKALEKHGFKVEDQVKSTVELQEKSIKESFPR